MINIITAMLFSISYRTANIEPNPIDYEYRLGLNGCHKSHLELIYERENGAKYTGLDYRVNSKYITKRILYKEAQGIDTQSFGIHYPFSNWKVGVALNSMKWNHGRPMLMILYDVDFVTASFEVGSRRQIFGITVSERYFITDHLFIEPLMRYDAIKDDGDEQDYWQSKLSLGYLFDVKGGKPMQ